MRKLFFIAVSLIFICCSSDNDSVPTETEPVLLKKIIATDVSGTQITDYHYSGNKILDGTRSNGSKHVYYYTGDLITKKAFFNTETTLSNEEIITYDSQNRVSETVVYYHTGGSNSALRNAYTHNSDGTISYERFTGDFTTQENLIKRGKFFFNAVGEVMKIEHYDINGNLLEKEQYEFDSKNSPFKNVLGFDKLFIHHSMSKLTNVVTYGLYGASNTLSHGYDVEYQYTTSNYPSNMIWNYSDGTELTYQLFYE